MLFMVKSIIFTVVQVPVLSVSTWFLKLVQFRLTDNPVTKLEVLILSVMKYRDIVILLCLILKGVTFVVSFPLLLLVGHSFVIRKECQEQFSYCNQKKQFLILTTKRKNLMFMYK